MEMMQQGRQSKRKKNGAKNITRREIMGKQGHFLEFLMGSRSVEGWVEKKKWDVAFMRMLGQDP